MLTLAPESRALSAKNCLGCAKYLDCKDKLKSVIYVCSSFKQTKDSKVAGIERLFDFAGLESPILVPTEVADELDHGRMNDPYAKEQAFNIQEVIKDMVSSNTMVSSDIKINDRDFPQAPNFYTFCRSEKYLNEKPFLEQAVLGTRILAEYCPDCTDMDWFEHTHKVNDSLAKFERKVALLEKGVCPHCKKGRSWFSRKKKFNVYREAAICAGQRSGKSAWLSMMAAYITHVQIKLQKPNEVYGLMNSNVLHGTFAALTYAQAKDTLWEPYYGYLTGSPFFSSYHKMLDRAEEQYGEELYKLKDTFVMYRHRRILVYPAGPDKRTLRGRCLIGSTMTNTNQGFVTLRELIGEDGQVPVKNLTVDSHKGPKEVSHTYKDIDSTIKVATRNGFTIEGTAEHPLLILNKELKYVWKRLDRLAVGDFIVSRTAKNSPLFGDNQDVSKDLATLLGYMVANGYRNEISSNDPNVVTRLFKSFKRVTGNVPTIKPGNKDRADSYYLKTGKQGEGNHFVNDYLRPLGYVATNSRNKSIPLSVRTAPKKILHEFLEAYFECDSGINGGSVKCNAPSEIEVGSASKKLATQLHVILFHAYNILGRIEKDVFYDKLNRDTGNFDAPRTHWTVTITGGDAYRFLQTFKRAKVQKYAERIRPVPAGYGSDRRNVPHIRKYLWDMFEDARLQDDSGKRLRRLKLHDGSTVFNQLKPNCFSKIRSGNAERMPHHAPEFSIYEDAWDRLLPLAESINPAKAKRIRKLLELGAHYEEVTAIKRKKKRVLIYDVTVPDGHAFTANCLASHNTRFLASIDELGYFDNSANSGKVKMDATEVYIALERSLLTVRAAARKLLKQGFDNIPTGYFLNISSPSSVRDKIMELVRSAQGSRKIYGIIKPTWEMNPKVSKADLAEEFRKDPVKAMRDYGAQPPLSASPLITAQSHVEAMFSDKKNPIRTKHYTHKTKDQHLTRYAKIEKLKQGGYPSCAAIDAGFSNNSFAIAVGHLEDKKRPIIDVLAEVMPLPGIPLNYRKIYDEIISIIIVSRNVKLLAADRWNSLKILSDAEEDFDILSRQFSLKYPDMQNFKSYALDGQLRVPKPGWTMEEVTGYNQSEYPECFRENPAEHFALQLLTVQDTGSSVVKGDQLTDDLVRAAMLCTSMLLMPDYEDVFNAQPEALKTRIDITQGAVMRGASGGGSGRGGGNASSVNPMAMGVRKVRN